MTRLIITPCGRQKQIVPVRADEMYTGLYAVACLRVARRLADADTRICILSAKHGLLELDWIIAPYDVAFGDPTAIDVAELRGQANERGLADIDDVRVLGGQRYVEMVRAVWPQSAPVIPPRTGGIGQQLAWLRKASCG